MKNSKKALLLMVCVMALVVSAVFGTLAYLTDSEQVTNTMTVGKVGISLDEAEVDINGAYVTDVNNRVTENTYKLMPGHSYIKDPVVHVDADSEASYIYVKVENEIAGIEAATTIADQIKANGWTALDGETNVYYKEWATADSEDLAVFATFSVKGEVTATELAAYADKTITVTAYAVQKDGFASASAAWTATFGAPVTE